MQTQDQQVQGPRREPSMSAMADHTTPLIENCWYIAARSHEVGQHLFARMILGHSVLMFRREDGIAVALQNRCLHRSFPLVDGTRSRDLVTCGYHGIVYSPDGRCQRIPSQDKIPSNYRLRVYPLVERGPYLWIWMGLDERANPADVPSFPWLTDGTMTYVEDYFYTKANYVGMQENVLDLTHASYLHGTDAATIKFAEMPATIEVEGNAVKVTRVEPESTMPPHRQVASGGIDRPVRRITESFFLTPAAHLAHSYYLDTSEPTGSTNYLSRFEIVHAFTPETLASTHYYWLNARDTDLDNDEISSVMHARSRKVYTEDVIALERIELLRQAELARGTYQEISILGDAAGIQMRRILARLAAEEQSTSD